MAWIQRAMYGGCVVICCGLAVLIPAKAIPHIGVSWDEPYQRHYGQTIISYLHHGDRALFIDSERYYGPLAPLTLQIPELITTTLPLSTLYAYRHWITWLWFLIGVVGVYQVSRLASIDRQRSILAALVVLTTPIIAGHALFNSKDIPFLTLTIWATWAACRFWKHPSGSTAGWLGVTFGLALLGRINALIPLGILVIVGGAVYGINRRSVALATAAIVGASLIMLAGWPTLWFNPIGEFIEAIGLMFRSPWGYTVLFNGELIASTDLPWMYLPVWMGITLNPVGLIAAGAATIGGLVSLRQWRQRRADPLVIILAPSIITMAAIMLLRPVIYDSWRQLLYIYPALVIGVVAAAQRLSRWSVGRWVEPAIWAAYWVTTLGTWITYFPYTHCYLNSWAGPRESIIYTWETDYWGVTNREVLESLPPGSTVIGDTYPAEVNVAIVSERRPLNLVHNPDTAHYLVSTHRWRQGPLALPTVAEVRRDGIVLSRVYKLRI